MGYASAEHRGLQPCKRNILARGPENKGAPQRAPCWNWFYSKWAEQHVVLMITGCESLEVRLGAAEKSVRIKPLLQHCSKRRHKKWRRRCGCAANGRAAAFCMTSASLRCSALSLMRWAGRSPLRRLRHPPEKWFGETICSGLRYALGGTQPAAASTPPPKWFPSAGFGHSGPAWSGA